jgi:hypothetical protein
MLIFLFVVLTTSRQMLEYEILGFCAGEVEGAVFLGFDIV